MPNTPGAKKRLRQSLVRRGKNRAVKSKLRSSIRKFRELTAEKQLDSAKEMCTMTARQLDQAAAKGIIHPNKAARLKSRLVRHIKTAQAS